MISHPLQAFSVARIAKSPSDSLAEPEFPSLSLGQAVAPQPFLRWAGGKTRLLHTILPHIPRTFVNYYEPFLGGGAVFFAVHARIQGHASLFDLNEELINAWQAVRNQPDEFLSAIAQYAERQTEKDYYAIRSMAPQKPLERAARFMFLNQTAWNGLWRVNRWGVFNVPWGARRFRGVDSETLQVASTALQSAQIEVCDFRTSLLRPKAGDFVYLDPPYLPISDTSKFSGYTERRFRVADLTELAELCRGLTERGVHWVASNRDNAAVRQLFSHAQVFTFTTRRAVAAQNRRDIQPVDSPEILIVGGPRA